MARGDDAFWSDELIEIWLLGVDHGVRSMFMYSYGVYMAWR